ncbi:tetratricopeptide repeat protein (plasmid) [Paracoccus sp. TK19116]|uniref:Tetratricopeptide repeat protein n=1 Tax=Paracoccus albicereus TaxID=2922394 RepID=A0ABT1MLA0_9RHOB|nr:tetratricopeptide repeat protein [Paracoccus albicereus]MCQ0969065.1 tetratricopeptide repeat protein [Paracoccus albicereus]
MANQNDSFIDEVTEELRRDRLYGAFRRYGWIGIALIVLIVGGAAWREWSLSRQTSDARQFGDAVLAAEQSAGPVDALSELAENSDSGHAVIAGLLAAGAAAEIGEDQRAAERLQEVAATAGEDDRIARDLARLKLVLAQGDAMNPADRDAALAELAQPGAPFELLALEQQAVALIGAGRVQDAVTLIRQIQQKDGLTPSLRRRLSEMMIALGQDETPDDSEAATAGAEAVQLPDAPVE